ncbi:MAG: ribosomal RNA small subunit methyltransferase A [Acidobacteria bacterium]|nr:ribosomal RNA small subunit methyltransferase A [Acidobacteriota bacterium]
MRARRRFGQHFLEPVWQRKVVDVIAPAPGDRFLEIGPGRGALTLALAGRGAEVVGVEVDRDLAAELAERGVAGVCVVCADVLEVDLCALVREMASAGGGAGAPRRVRVAANLPYNISSPVLFRLIEVARSTGLVDDATLMLQREVAVRVAASPGGGDYGPLSVMTQLYADVELVLALPPGAFRPPPKVQSAVIRLRFRPPPVEIADLTRFDAMVRGLFTRRRKTLLNALRACTGPGGLDLTAVLERAGLDGRRRPETLTLAELALLASQLSPAR